MSHIELKLQGRNPDGSLTGKSGTVFCVNGEQAEEGLVKFHGRRAFDELGYDKDRSPQEREEALLS